MSNKDWGLKTAAVNISCHGIRHKEVNQSLFTPPLSRCHESCHLLKCVSTSVKRKDDWATVVGVTVGRTEGGLINPFDQPFIAILNKCGSREAIDNTYNLFMW